MRELLCLALAVTSLACTGGSDPVRTVGGDREYEGPGALDPSGDEDGTGTPTTSLSTLVALCIKACAHVHAADCESATEQSTGSCELLCAQEAGNVQPSCADESAAVHACTIDAKITCSGDIMDTPIIDGCDSESSELQKCIAPGSDCVISNQQEETCFQFGLSVFMICSPGVEPPKDCLQVAPDGFCCP